MLAVYPGLKRLSFLFMVLFSVLPLWGQLNSGSITGTVKDTTGAVVPGAGVVATQVQTSFTAKTVSGSGGDFSFATLPVGPYKLTITSTGFSTYERTGIVLNVGEVANVPVALTLGGVTEKVEVNAGTSRVETTDNTIQNVIPDQVVQDLPLNGRNPATLLFTVAGVTNAAQDIGGPNKNGSLYTVSGAGTTLPGQVAPSAHGVQTGGTYFSLDGANNLDEYTLLPGPFPNPDATQEFNAQTATYGARYLSAPGGAVSIITRSGTNKVHGVVFEYIRNGYFNATIPTFGGPGVPDTLKRNQFGVSAGGPILKNRLFVFGAYQGTRQTQNTVGTSVVLPTALERTGVFTTVAGNTVNFAPLGLSKVTQNYLKYLPLPGASGTFTPVYKSVNNDGQYVGKLDYDFGAHRVFARYFGQHFSVPVQSMQNNNLFTSRSGSFTLWDSYAVGDTWAGKHWLTDTRVSYNSITNKSQPDPVASQLTLASFGAMNYTASNHGGTPITAVGSGVIVGGGQFTSLPRRTFEVSEDVGYTKGKHQVGFGFDLRRIGYGENNEAGQSGVFVFPGVTSIILATSVLHNAPPADAATADFILGTPLIGIQGDGFLVTAKGYVYGLYAEDKYRLTNRVTLTAGVRFDPFTPFSPENNQIDCYIPGEQSQVFVNAPKGLVYPGDPGCNGQGTSAKYNIVQPRVGVAWDPYGDGKTALRAGYGMYAEQLPLQTFLGFAAPPYVRTFTVGPQPFLSWDNFYASAGIATNPFAAGFHGPGYTPPSNVAFPAVPFGAAAFSPNLRPGLIQQYTLSGQQQLGASDSIELAYVGTKGTYIPAGFDVNLPVYGPGATSTNEQARRPNPALGAVGVLRSVGNTNYNALEFTYEHRSSFGLYARSALTWARCIDEGSAPATAGSITAVGPDASDRRGRCDFDENLAYRATLNQNLPTLSGHNALMRYALGGWVGTGLLTVDGGQPFSVVDTSDDSLTGIGTTPSGNDIALADRVPSVPVFGANGVINKAAFAHAATGTFGNSGRNAYRAPGYRDVDVAVFKNFPIKEGVRLVFRTEAFNVFNFRNPYPEDANLNSATFGQFVAFRQQQRTLQFSLRVEF